MIGTEWYRISIDLHPTPPIAAHQPAVEDPATSDYRISTLTVSGFNAPLMSEFLGLEPLKAMSLGNGAIRLFRDFEPADAPLHSAAPPDDTMLSIIAVPTYFTATDILGFVGDHYMEFLTHIRVLKSEKPNRFLVLLKFNDPIKAAEFQYHYDGKPFNSMEPEACHVVYVKLVSLCGAEPEPSSAHDYLIPFLLRDPFTSLSQPASVESSPLTSAIPVELPTCPVCLERLDCEVSGLLTIPCQHTFHCQCLSKWRDDTCPVCRYTNNVSNHRIKQSVRRLLQINSLKQLQLQQQQVDESLSAVHDPSDSCMGCETSDNLWMCLICGNIGCSRYAPEQHSLKHFVETGHCFAMELLTSRVWDYAGDSYVHRLITNESDGKIVEFPEKVSSDAKPQKGDDDNSEYSELLLSQLVSQREYYELLLRDRNLSVGMLTRRGSSVTESSSGSQKMADMEAKIKELTERFEQMTLAVIPALKKKIEMKEVTLKMALQELADVNAVNDGLSEKIEFLQAENVKLKQDNEELMDQVKDLMFYLESQEKFKDQPEDVREGQIVMQPKKSAGKKKKR